MHYIWCIGIKRRNTPVQRSHTYVCTCAMSLHISDCYYKYRTIEHASQTNPSETSCFQQLNTSTYNGSTTVHYVVVPYLGPGTLRLDTWSVAQSDISLGWTLTVLLGTLEWSHSDGGLVCISVVGRSGNWSVGFLWHLQH